MCVGVGWWFGVVGCHGMLVLLVWVIAGLCGWCRLWLDMGYELLAWCALA